MLWLSDGDLSNIKTEYIHTEETLSKEVTMYLHINIVIRTQSLC